MNNPSVQSGFVPKSLLLANVFMALLYFSWWFWPGHVGNPILYGLLLFGEFYHVFMAIGFWITVWPRNKTQVIEPTLDNPSVAIFITVAGEPVQIVEQTAKAARNLSYPNHKVYILNDSYVAKKDNWREIEEMAKRLGVECITRKIGGGAKAGNINNGLRNTKSDLVAILDADMVPHENFLDALVPYFSDLRIGFVQSPQFYKNQGVNTISAGAWEQQNFFFGPIMRGKNTLGSAFICGTNVVIRRTTLEQSGGINEKNVAEDFVTSLFIHKNKWKSVYVSEVLCEGLAPEDLLSYYKQQHRWARGSIEVLFTFNPFFKRGLTWSQRLQYLLSAMYYMNGLIVLIDIIMPLLFLLFNQQAVAATTTSFALFFIPYMFLNLYTIYLVSGQSVTFRAISFSQASWILQLSALRGFLLRRKASFAVTAKEAQEGNYLFLIYPHLFYIFISFVAIGIGYYRHGAAPSVVTNSAWVLFNIVMFMPFITAAYNWKSLPQNILRFFFPRLRLG